MEFQRTDYLAAFPLECQCNLARDLCLDRLVETALFELRGSQIESDLGLFRIEGQRAIMPTNYCGSRS